MTQKQNSFSPGDVEKLRFEKYERNAVDVCMGGFRGSLSGRFFAIGAAWRFSWFNDVGSSVNSLLRLCDERRSFTTPVRVVCRCGEASSLKCTQGKGPTGTRTFRSFLRDLEYCLALVLNFSDYSVPICLGAMDKVDCSRVPVPQGHRFDRGMKPSSEQDRKKSTESSGYWVYCDADTSAITWKIC